MLDLQSEDELASDILKELVEPWYHALKNPQEAQEDVLRSLLKGYADTDYGRKFNASRIGTIEEFQRSFPISSYASLRPHLDQVQAGNYSALLPEPVSHWVMTRGTTGHSKVIPATESHLSQILSNGSRAIINFALKKDIEVMKKNVLNLNFPSDVSVMTGPTGEAVRYGYSSGTYAKLFPSLDSTSLVPKQEEIDSLGGGITKRDWEKRFDLVYERAKDSNVGTVMGVTQVIEAFGAHLKRKYKMLPKEIWKMNALFCTSMAKIQTKLSPTIKHYYGASPLVEMYSATEGVFAQQLDDLPYVSPNYDSYLFEVKTARGIKMLHEMKPNEWGRIIISSCLFPRYDIGDLIEALGRGYFRVFGRAKTFTILEHQLSNLVTGRF